MSACTHISFVSCRPQAEPGLVSQKEDFGRLHVLINPQPRVIRVEGCFSSLQKKRNSGRIQVEKLADSSVTNLSSPGHSSLPSVQLGNSHGTPFHPFTVKHHKRYRALTAPE